MKHIITVLLLLTVVSTVDARRRRGEYLEAEYPRWRIGVEAGNEIYEGNLYKPSSIRETQTTVYYGSALTSDLLPLHNRRVDLKTETEVQMTTGDGVTNVLDIISGEFYFKRVQLLSVDEKENRVIISGTFNLAYRTDNGFSSSFSNGRFDFGIDKLYNN
jgi:hypothetical protein